MNADRRKFFTVSTLGMLATVPVIEGVRASTIVNSSIQPFIYVKDFGAIGDGTTDDSLPIQSAIDFAILKKLPLVLQDTHRVDVPLNIVGNLVIAHRETPSIINTGAFSGSLFVFTGEELVIGGIKTEGITLVRVLSDFDKVWVHHCDCTGLSDNYVEYIVDTGAEILAGHELVVENNKTLYMSGVFAEGMHSGDIHFRNNQMRDSTRFILRALKGEGFGNNHVFFENNQILGMNTTLPDQTTAARVVQVDAKELTQIKNNYVRDLHSTTAANLVYFRSGNLTCIGNTCINAHGSEAWIHDKGSEFGNHVIKQNIFEQTNVQNDTLDSVIKIYTGSNFTVSENEFIGLHSPACWVWESVDNLDRTPSNNAIIGNTLRDIEFPFAFKLVQPSNNTVVKNNTLYKISNPANVVSHGEKVPKFIFIYVSVSNGKDIENVSIDGNVMFDSRKNTEEPVAEFIKIYRHTIATNSSIKNIYITDNKAFNVSTFCKFVGLSIESCVIANNVGKTGALVVDGLNLPLLLRQQNNLF